MRRVMDTVVVVPRVVSLRGVTAKVVDPGDSWVISQSESPRNVPFCVQVVGVLLTVTVKLVASGGVVKSSQALVHGPHKKLANTARSVIGLICLFQTAMRSALVARNMRGCPSLGSMSVGSERTVVGLVVDAHPAKVWPLRVQSVMPGR